MILSRAAWLVASVAAAVCVQSIYHQPVGWAPMALVTAMMALAAIRPFAALLAIATLTPAAQFLFLTIRTGTYDVDFADALILAFISGCGARFAISSRRPAVPAWLLWSTLALTAVAVASATVQWTTIAMENPERARWGFVPAFLLRDYLIQSNHITIAVHFLQGLIVLLITATTCAGDPERRRSVVQMLLAGAVVAAVLTLGRLVQAAWAAQDPFWAAFAGLFATTRISAYVRDGNAVGSYYALMIFCALGTLQWSRWLGGTAIALSAAGLWMAGSRMALAATFATMAVCGLIARRGRSPKAALVAGLAILAVTAVALWSRYPATRTIDTVEWAYASRMELIKGGFQLARQHPVFGVGLGQYYELSVNFTGTMLVEQGRARENAHNYFVQVLAELGLTGFLLFVSLLVAVLRGASLTASPPGLQLGAMAGLLAFLVTCSSGHPFLTPSVAGVFWIVAGATAAEPPAIDGRRLRLAGLAAILLIALTLPLRVVHARQHAYLEHTSVGFSRWQRDPAGLRYRFAGGRSTFYVPSAATSVVIPLRLGNRGPASIELRILVAGREATRMVLEGPEWHDVRIVPIRGSSSLFSRIDLAVTGGLDEPADDTSGLVLVGRPTVDQ